MKNYFFEPNDWDDTFTVMALSKENALEKLLQYMRLRPYHAYDKWCRATVDNLPDEYTIEECGPDDIIQGAYS